MNIQAILENESLTKYEKMIANYISKNVTRIPYMTVQELAQELKVSTATVSRFFVTIGFSGFKQFKDYFKSTLDITPANKMEDIINKVENKDIPTEIMNKSIQYLRKTVQRLSRKEFNRAVEALIQAKRIYIYGSGPSESLSDLLAFRLNRFDFDIKKMAKSGHELYESLLHLTKEDAVFIFGFFNTLPETQVILNHAKEVGFTTILVTDLVISDMIDNSDIVLFTERGELWEFHSMVAPIALVESIIVSLAMNNEEKYLSKLHDLHKLRKKYASYLPK